MRTPQTATAWTARIVIAATLACAGCATRPDADTGPHAAPVALERMPQTLELRYAASAAPPHLRDDATIYTLDPAKGYAPSHQGTNGFTCIVVRSDWQWPRRPFRDDIIWPVCYDAEGSKTLLQDYMLAAALRSRGMDAAQVHREVTNRFGTPVAPNPARTGIAYMLAPIMRTVGDQNLPEPVTANMPHYMFYAPHVKDADIGGKQMSQYPFMLSMSPGRDDVIILLAGEAEKAKILSDSTNLLAELCAYRKYLCTTDITRLQKPVD